MEKLLLVLTLVCFVIGMPPNIEVEPEEDLDETLEYGDCFEGDMVLSDDQFDELNGNRIIIKNKEYRWFNATVPYKFSSYHTPEQNGQIVKAFAKIENISCVRFTPYTNETDYVQIEV